MNIKKKMEEGWNKKNIGHKKLEENRNNRGSSISVPIPMSLFQDLHLNVEKQNSLEKSIMYFITSLQKQPPKIFPLTLEKFTQYFFSQYT